MAAKIKKGDTVISLIGKDRGKEGEVLKVFPDKGKATVKDLNVYVRHMKPAEGRPGGKGSKSMPMALSNLAVKDPKTGKATRVGFRVDKDGQKVRFAKASGEPLP